MGQTKVDSVTDESSENYVVRTYSDISTLTSALGQEDDWAARIASHGEKHSLSDGTTVWVGTLEDAEPEGGREDAFVLIGNGDRHEAYRLNEDDFAALVRDVMN